MGAMGVDLLRRMPARVEPIRTMTVAGMMAMEVAVATDPAGMQRWDGLLLNARLVTLDVAPGYGVIEHGALAWRDGLLAYVGPADALPDQYARLAAQVIDAQSRCVTPGLVDCHTHVVFAGDRATEFEQRLQGASYEDIARNGRAHR